MLLIADALTVVYLRPYLVANGYSEADVDRIVVWYDPSAVATRNDRAADADSGFEKMAVSFETWRRTHGFSDADAPSPTELGLRILLQKGMITPELSEAMLAAVAPEIIQAAREAQQQQSVAPMPDELNQMLQGQAPGAPAAPEAAPQSPEEAPTVGPDIQLAEPTTEEDEITE
jgi:hypothetical protein